MAVALSFEVMRLLTGFYLSVALQPIQHAFDEHPPLLTMMNEEYNPIIAVLQYLAALVFKPRECGRLWIIMCIRGCVSFDSWFGAYPEDYGFIQLGALVLIAAIEKRQLQYLLRRFGVLLLATTACHSRCEAESQQNLIVCVVVVSLDCRGICLSRASCGVRCGVRRWADRFCFRMVDN